MSEMGVKVVASKVSKGLFRLVGVTHSGCGGQVYAEWFPAVEDEGEMIPASWECYCDRCQDCDPDGYGSLRECLEVAAEAWGTRQASKVLSSRAEQKKPTAWRDDCCEFG